MTRLVVLDSSALVALLVDAAALGDWVADAVAGAAVAAPELAPFEAANVLRRQQLAGLITPVEATLAHEDLVALPMQLWPYAALAERAWELRETLTCYDAAYVALAELTGATVVTLDVRLARASGPRCAITTPPDGTAAGSG